MWVQQAVDARWFATRARAQLDRYPVESNVLATWLEVELAGRVRPSSRWWLVSADDGVLVGVGFQADGHPLQLGPMPAGASAALATHHAQTGLDPHGVSGVQSCADDFAQAWRSLTGAVVRATVAMRIHALTEVTTPQVPGSGRRAGPADVDLCETWLTAFSSEVLPDDRRDTVRPMVERRVRGGELWLWEHGGEPVSLAGVTPAVAGVARVAPVYTPPVFRRRGYGRAVTALASVAALTTGARRCMLHTDLADPVSNSIYRSLGYQPVADAVRHTFGPATLPLPTPSDGVTATPLTPSAGVPPTAVGPHNPVPPVGATVPQRVRGAEPE